jgi:ABC-2 type transport system permease protein
MNPTVYAARLGLARGWAEFRQSLTDPQQLGAQVFFAVAFVIVLLFQRNSTVEGTNVSLAFAVLPGILGMMVAIGGLQGAAGSLAVEREDGTLLRAKAVPNGMVGYLTGRVVSVSLSAILGLVIILVPSLFLIPELTGIGLTGWLTFIWVLALGLLATLPIGAVIGSLAKSPNTVNGLVTLPIIGVTAISGIFYPIFALPGWVQAIAQVSRSTGSDSACARPSCRIRPLRWRSVSRGGTWRPSGCWGRGHSSALSWRRWCSAAWHVGSPAPTWRPAVSGRYSASAEKDELR